MSRRYHFQPHHRPFITILKRARRRPQNRNMKVWDDSDWQYTWGRPAAYWAFQASWWGLFAAIGLAINVINGGNVPNLVIGHILLLPLQYRSDPRFSRAESSGWRLRQPPVIRMRLRLFAGSISRRPHPDSSGDLHRYRVEWTAHETWPRIAVVSLGWGMYIGTIVWTLVYVRITERHAQEQREVQMQLALREAELRALEAQINPHFLFNCLNSIRGLVVEDPHKAQDMITRFATLLRYNLNHEPGTHGPVSRRKPRWWQITWRWKRSASRTASGFRLPSIRRRRALLVPPMILQTLVENALKHGIARLPQGGDLQIRASASNGRLVLEVDNSGELTDQRIPATLNSGSRTSESACIRSMGIAPAWHCGMEAEP